MKIIKIDYGQLPLFASRDKNMLVHFDFLDDMIIYTKGEEKKEIKLNDDPEVFNNIITLLKDADIESWDKSYVDNRVLDGQVFRAYIYFDDGSVKEVKCQNKYPKGFKNLREINRICYYY